MIVWIKRDFHPPIRSHQNPRPLTLSTIFPSPFSSLSVSVSGQISPAHHALSSRLRHLLRQHASAQTPEPLQFFFLRPPSLRPVPAMALSSSFAGAKMEKLLLCSAPSSSSSSMSRAVSMQLSQVGLLKRRGLAQRVGAGGGGGGVKPAVRCEVSASGAASETQKIDTLSLSALEQLKASAADSES